VGLQPAHVELLGQRQGGMVMGFGPHDVQRVTTPRNLAEQPQGPRLLTPHLALMGANVCIPSDQIV
jgi:hypothetical protein